MSKLSRDFFHRDAVVVARELLGKSLYRCFRGKILGGVIIETEAYVGEDDSACHASRGCTPRTRVMYERGGCYYVYLIYGMYHMLNIVTGDEGHPQAVLIRALRASQGLDQMQQLRGNSRQQNLCNGPGKLCQALSVDRSFNTLPVDGEELWLQNGSAAVEQTIVATPRVGIGYATMEDQQKPWRFLLETN